MDHQPNRTRPTKKKKKKSKAKDTLKRKFRNWNVFTDDSVIVWQIRANKHVRNVVINDGQLFETMRPNLNTEREMTIMVYLTLKLIGRIVMIRTHVNVTKMTRYKKRKKKKNNRNINEYIVRVRVCVCVPWLMALVSGFSMSAFIPFFLVSPRQRVDYS